MPRDRFIIIAVILILMWLGLMVFFYLKADEVTKDPCSICAKRMGKDVNCITAGTNPITKTFYTNGSITIGNKAITSPAISKGLEEYARS